MHSPFTHQVQTAILDARLAKGSTPPAGSRTKRSARRLLESSRRRCIRVGVMIAVAVAASVGVATPALAASTTFGYSPGYQYFTVPSGVNSIHFDVIGGAGANGQGTYGGGRGGSGAEVTGDFRTSPGQVLTIWAGGAGQPGGGDGYGNPTHDDFDGGSGGSGYGLTTGNGGGGGAASYIKSSGGYILGLAGGGGGGGGGGIAGSIVGDGSDGAWQAAASYSSGWFADAVSGGNTDVLGGVGSHENGNNGGDGTGGGDGFFFGGGGGGGGGGYRDCITGASTQTGTYCFSAGGGGQGSPDDGGAGGAGGDSYADSFDTGVSFRSSGNAPSAAGQVTLSYATASSTTVGESSATSLSGQSVRFTTDVNPTDGGGTVTFDSDGTAISGCSNLSFEAGGGSDWLTSCTTSSLPVGTHTITATYSGDGNYAPSSASTTETVQPAQQATTTSLNATPSSLPVGRKAKLTATVHSGDGGGTVAFTNNNTNAPLAGCSAVPLVAVSGSYQAVCTSAWVAPGTYPIRATYSGDSGNASSSGSTTVTANPAPIVFAVSPKAGPTAGGQTVTITGADLSGATKVSFGTVPATNVTVVSDLQLTATIPAHAAGTVNVTVTTPLGTSAVISYDHYTYDALPTVSSITPATGPKGTVVTVNGTGFVAGLKVMFGTTPASKVVRVSATQLQATAPAGSGTVGLTVTTPGGTSATSPADQFTYAG